MKIQPFFAFFWAYLAHLGSGGKTDTVFLVLLVSLGMWMMCYVEFVARNKGYWK